MGNGVLLGDNSSMEYCEVKNCLDGISDIRMGGIDKCIIKSNQNGIIRLTDSRVTNNM